jgi:formylglycine-generating enzyme required for sulfatase activity
MKIDKLFCILSVLAILVIGSISCSVSLKTDTSPSKTLVALQNTEIALAQSIIQVTQLSQGLPTNTPIPAHETTVTVLTTLTTWTRPADGMVMVFVPAGEFEMGSNDVDIDQLDQKPVHTVVVDSFFIDRTEVTNGQWKKCVAAGICDKQNQAEFGQWDDFTLYYDNPIYANYPMILINWNQVSAYCSWADARLPTEAEWEYAARGPDDRIYPWGNDPPTCDKANFDVEGAALCVGKPSAVGSYPAGASWVGALDMAGNVSEWVADWYGPYSSEKQGNPTGPSLDAGGRVVRGGAANRIDRYIRTSSRSQQGDIMGTNFLGFRCAHGISP